MAFFIVEVTVARVASLHCSLQNDLSGVQVHPHHGAAGPLGKADQVVQAPVNRFVKMIEISKYLLLTLDSTTVDPNILEWLKQSPQKKRMIGIQSLRPSRK